MARVIITESLFKAIRKRFSTAEAQSIVDALESLEGNPHKGKILGAVDRVIIKEIRYQKYRFYCLTDGHILKFGSVEELASVLIKFVRMSEKKDQQRAIEEIKLILRSMGLEGF